MATETFVRAASLADLQEGGCLSARVDGHNLALFRTGDAVYAVDNRCPHMGFPLDRGTVRDGILTCHWHHARFDLASGGAFDLFADDATSFPVEIRDGEIWIDLAPRVDQRARHRRRLRDGLERGLSLVIAKSVIGQLDRADGEAAREPFRTGLEFGTRYRRDGWGPGLTVLTCMRNLLPHLGADDHARALFHGLANVAADSSGEAPRFELQPLPRLEADFATLKRWFRRFVEVRDADGAERCIVSAVRGGADHRQMADMLFAAATDHRYIATGHALDFTNKALEALDSAGWEQAERVLGSLAAGYASARRMEESNTWRSPDDLIEILARAFDQLPAALEQGRARRGGWDGQDALVTVLLGEGPDAIASSLLNALRDGAGKVELAGTVAYAAALRIARFHTSNEFGDWDTALHTFTFANAVHQGLRRAPSVELLRGVFDAAMSVYLDRFLNVPPARIPEPRDVADDPDALLAELPAVLDRQQQVDQAGELVARYLHAGGGREQLRATLGALLLREDRDFHTIQMIEAAFRQSDEARGAGRDIHVLIAAARYLAAHAPTVRSQGQTFRIAYRLHRGERIYEGD